jgi:Glycoside-hydrolase family GH114
VTKKPVDAYDNKEANPMGLTSTTAIEYLGFLVNTTARPLNLAIGLKNGLKLAEAVSPWLDWEVNEQCASPPNEDNSTARENECGQLTPFVNKNKPVFHVEYDVGVPGGVSAANISILCDSVTTKGFSNVLKRLALDGNTQYCP